MSDDPTKVTEIFHGEPRERLARNPMCDRMERCAGVMGQNFAGDLAGYIVIAIDHKGAWSIGHGVDPDCPIGTSMLAGLGLSAIHREMIAEEQIRDALVRNHLVQPPPGEKG